MHQAMLKGLGGLLAVALVALVSFNAGAGSATGAAHDDGGSMWERVHDLGRKLHGHAPHAASAVHGADRHLETVSALLDLTPEQADRIVAVHERFAAHHDAYRDSLTALHEELIGQFRAGVLDADTLKTAFDGRLDNLREAGHAAVEEVVALADSLDADQRDALLRHFDPVAGPRVF